MSDATTRVFYSKALDNVIKEMKTKLDRISPPVIEGRHSHSIASIMIVGILDADLAAPVDWQHPTSSTMKVIRVEGNIEDGSESINIGTDLTGGDETANVRNFNPAIQGNAGDVIQCQNMLNGFCVVGGGGGATKWVQVFTGANDATRKNNTHRCFVYEPYGPTTKLQDNQHIQWRQVTPQQQLTVGNTRNCCVRPDIFYLATYYKGNWWINPGDVTQEAM